MREREREHGIMNMEGEEGNGSDGRVVVMMEKKEIRVFEEE